MYMKIRYRGRLRQPADVSHLADEVEDICQSNGWKHEFSASFYTESVFRQ